MVSVDQDPVGHAQKGHSRQLLLLLLLSGPVYVAGLPGVEDADAAG
jgi:hypothetical protein